MDSASFPRWMLPWAAGISLAVGAFWWATTIRNETAQPAILRDHGREWVIGSEDPQALPSDLPVELREAIAETLRTGRLTIAPEIAALLETSATFARRRSARPNTFRISIASLTALADARPHLRWTRAEGATSYRVQLAAVPDQRPLVVAEVPATANEWSPAEPLPAGGLYEWSVEALRDGAVLARAPSSSEPQARFRVLPAMEREVWKRARSLVGDSSLLRGIVAARAGLLEEAAEEFRALGRQNPRAERARMFLEQVDTSGAH